MKYLPILAAWILWGCVATQVKDPTPPQMIRSSECYNTTAIKFAQVNDDVSLVQLYNVGVLQNNGEYFAIDTKIFEGDLYDGVFVPLKSGDCFASDGTYSYYSTLGSKRTIRKITIKKANIENPAYKEWLKAQETKDEKSGNDEGQ